MEKEYTYHLGITMAGAVSAGCYTAGVMDYLFEVLDLWERAKKGKVKEIDVNLVPKNNVVIDVMGGTSAGGMATIMSCLYAIKGNIAPVKSVPNDPYKSMNILYDSWVHLDDNSKDGDTFSKIWDTDDLNERLVSLFNSKVIEAIADRSFEGFNDIGDYAEHIKSKLPRFISPNLEVLLSHTLLRGIPLAVDFKTKIAKKRKDSPNHNTFEHYLISHFKLNSGNKINENEFLWLNPYLKVYADKMKLSTISTGAFPVGLAYREFNQNQFNDEYIKTNLKKIVTGDFSDNSQDIKDRINISYFPKNYISKTVDGGAINNEPYREVVSILEGKLPVKDGTPPEFGLFMIDPFPDSGYTEEEYDMPTNLLSVVPQIIQTLWNQSKVKRREMIEQYETDYFKGLIFPSKFNTNIKNEIAGGRDHKPLACASFNAFGGFLDVNFRVHDYFLGRNNARNFIQYFASFPYDREKNIVHPMHENWTQQMIGTFGVSSDGIKYLPIIPDLNILLEGYESGERKYAYDVRNKPKYDSSKLFALKDRIEDRFNALIYRAVMDFYNRNKKVKSVARSESTGASKDDKGIKSYPIADSLLEKEYKDSFFKNIASKVGDRVFVGLSNQVKNYLAKLLAKMVIMMILRDLEDRELLKKGD